MPASSMAIALASPGPIQMGSTRLPSSSWRMTTGVLVFRSRPRCATRTSTSAELCGSGAKIPRGQVLLLLRRQSVYRDVHGAQLQPRDLAIQLRGDSMDVLRQL